MRFMDNNDIGTEINEKCEKMGYVLARIALLIEHSPNRGVKKTFLEQSGLPRSTFHVIVRRGALQENYCPDLHTMLRFMSGISTDYCMALGKLFLLISTGKEAEFMNRIDAEARLGIEDFYAYLDSLWTEEMHMVQENTEYGNLRIHSDIHRKRVKLLQEIYEENRKQMKLLETFFEECLSEKDIESQMVDTMERRLKE